MIDRRSILTGSAAVLAAAALPLGPVIKQFIMPSLMYAEHMTETVRDNTRTIFYEIMERWTTRDGKLVSIETAKVGSQRYWQWLAEETEPRNHYPHIQFGGAVVAGKGDPEFHKRWLAYARTLV
jgi:TAT (twin-arginine translocation) pathway signal sequence